MQTLHTINSTQYSIQILISASLLFLNCRKGAYSDFLICHHYALPFLVLCDAGILFGTTLYIHHCILYLSSYFLYSLT
jgi:hypothetical protein